MHRSAANPLCFVVVLLVCLGVAQDAAAVTPPRDGLVLWLDATDVDGNGNPGDEPASGQGISQWADKSGQGNHVTSGDDDTKGPRLEHGQLGGRPVVRFDGEDRLTRSEFVGFAFRDQPIHMIIVMRSASHDSRSPRVLEFQPIDGDLAKPATVKQHGFWIGPNGDGRMRIGTHYGDQGSALTVAWDGQPHVAEVVYAGAQSWIHYLDGARDGGGLFGDRDFHGFTKAVRLTLGQQFGAAAGETSFAGDLAEVLVYGRVLSAQEQNTLKTYLSRKWPVQLAIHAVPHFERDVLPILSQHCHECHGADLQESELDLRSVTAMLRGGRGGPVISRGHPEFSEVVEQIRLGKMPPDDPLESNQIAVIRRWIEVGAPADEHVTRPAATALVSGDDRAFWAFQRRRQHTPPKVTNAHRVRTPIDSFVLAQLESQGLALASDADRITIVRRACFDLTGLPPAPEDVALFLADRRQGAYERLIDRLLASPHFGERWGRSWLDWSGYVDVYGKDNDFAIIKPLDGRWRYRDYVVRSMNANKPFDRFLTEQLAGDELVDWRNAPRFTPEIVELLTATGFLLCSDDDTDQNELNTPAIRHHVLQQTAEIVANNVFALTVQCSKCHDHKYEPITQLDYYRWLANFSPVFNPQRWVTSVEHGIPNVSRDEQKSIDRWNQQIDEQVAQWTTKRQALRETCRDRVQHKRLARLDAQSRTRLRRAIDTQPAARDDEQQKLLAEHKDCVSIATTEIDAALTDQERAAIGEINDRIKALKLQKRAYDTIQVAVEQNPPSATYVLRRGEFSKPGVEVQPAQLSILTEAGRPHPQAPSHLGVTSGRRLAIAVQITDPDSIAGALVARVIANRVWQELFGKGIVETSDNFGVSGARPSHPALLEWLADDFIRRGWDVKHLIRQMVLSSVYRQDSIRRDLTAARQADPANTGLWRARLRRLPSEAIRDRVLAVSGQLDRTLGGLPVPLLAQADGKITIDMDQLPTPTSHLRRSLYILNRRNYHLSILTTFDQPFLTSNCTCRKPSAVVTQSLTMLNDDFIIQQAAHFADRVMANAGSTSPRAWVKVAYQIGLCRLPSEIEQQLCIQLIERHTERYRRTEHTDTDPRHAALVQLCHTIMNTNEFLYVP